MAETLRWCQAEGITSYDLLPPSDPYKARWTTTSVPVADYGLALTPKGVLWLDIWQARLRPALKRFYSNAAPALRRVLSRLARRA